MTPRNPGTSRLWHRLGATEPLFQIYSDTGFRNINDHNTLSVSISRGTAGPDYGVFPQTLEVATIVPLGIRTGTPIWCELTDYALSLIAPRIGASAAHIRMRYYGRIGKQTIDDISPTEQYATLHAAGWEAQLNNITEPVRIPSGRGIGRLVVDMSNPTGQREPRLRQEINLPAPSEQYGLIAETEEPSNYSEAIGKYVENLGFYLQTKRDGTGTLWPNQYRFQYASDHRKTDMPLTRSAAISPATWENGGTDISRNHRVEWTGPDRLYSNSYGYNTTYPNIPVVLHKMHHGKWDTNWNQPRRTAQAHLARDAVNRYSVTSLEIDLLYLITSRFASHRTQAKQLLELEAGDPIFLSKDWNPYVDGIQFATGITETITPDGWRMKIDLQPSELVTGYVSLDVPPKVWDSAQTEWNETAGTWHNL